MDAHVIFVCDISGSMQDRDINEYNKPTSGAQFSWIKNAHSGKYWSSKNRYHSGLDNRLGALYSHIHSFIDIRLKNGMMNHSVLLFHEITINL